MADMADSSTSVVPPQHGRCRGFRSRASDGGGVLLRGARGAAEALSASAVTPLRAFFQLLFRGTLLLARLTAPVSRSSAK
mmetsp:Transcript_413/g.1315  ORF Transcript_413/g.1315 Transcript_413/m.1315 type:complete len:80 (+) Transcript_413:1188-1427(+)